MVSKGRRFDGENTCFYFLWYGLGRAWVEGLRTDSLYLFDWTFLGQPIRVSQALSVLLAVAAAALLFYNIKIKKHDAADLLVNQVALTAAAEDAAQTGESVEPAAEAPAQQETVPAPESAAAQAPEETKGEADHGDPH